MKVKYLWLCIAVLAGLYACKEGERYGLDISATSPPAMPDVKGTLSLNGGVRFYYEVPRDNDILAVKAEYVNEAGEMLSFSKSYFSDSIDVVGFADTTYYDVRLYAINRAGQQSKAIIYSVKPKESVISMVAKSIKVKRSFGSLFVEWNNELEWPVNVFVYFKFRQQGLPRELVEVFSSNLDFYRGIIYDLDMVDNSTVEVEVRVEDKYANSTAPIPFGTIDLFQDMKIPKKFEDGSMKWTMPNPGDSIAGVPQFWGNFGEGRNEKIINDILDFGNLLDFCHTNDRGYNGNPTLPDSIKNRWNALINLGGWYQISRCLTHQRMVNGTSPLYFGGINLDNNWNVGRYRMYVLNEDVDPPQWEYIREHRVPIPKGLPELEVLRLANAGDIAYLYPEDPQFSRPTRWFRYESRGAFPNDYAYTSGGAYNLSEITLFGQKVDR